MPASVDLVIFDCDGVLVDSERIAVHVEARLISELGWPVTEDDVLRRFVGRTDEYMLAEIERVLGRTVPGFHDRYLEELHSAFLTELRPVDGIVEVLPELRQATCVASSGTHQKMHVTLGLTGLRDFFEGRIYSASDVLHGKPAPDLFLYAARSVGVPPDRCVVVEDSKSGVEAARRAGMRSLGYAGGLTPASWLAGTDTIVFEDMAQLAALIDGLAKCR
jgi:HAD superfamily hydrolase (TIGR01509 family)